jgi:hypothetical protein
MNFDTGEAYCRLRLPLARQRLVDSTTAHLLGGGVEPLGSDGVAGAELALSDLRQRQRQGEQNRKLERGGGTRLFPFVDKLDVSLKQAGQRGFRHHTGLFGKQPRIAAMKTMLISGASLIFISGTALAREVIVSPVVPSHGAGAVAEHRTAQLQGASREGGVPCTTKYITITRGDGSSETHKSVNCEE